jgi:hypothetical protein
MRKELVEEKEENAVERKICPIQIVEYETEIGI